MKTNILVNFDFMFLIEDIQRILSSTELFLSNRYIIPPTESAIVYCHYVLYNKRPEVSLGH